MADYPKITLTSEKCWIIRLVKIKAGTTEIEDTMYMESPNRWNRSPAAATIVQSMDAAEEMIKCYKVIALNMIKGYKEENEILDVISYYDEIVNGKHGIRFEVKDGKVRRIN